MKHAWVALIAVGFAGCITPGPEDRAKARGYHEMSTDVQVEKVAHKKEKRPAPSPARLAASCKVSLSAAIESALGKVKGQALNAEVELENGKALIEVTIVLDGKVWEVEIDGTTGAVIEVEQEDDDDDDDDDDDEDGDDD